MNHEQHENNIVRAYKLGIEHGREGDYRPPQWCLLQNSKQLSLALASYKNGFSEGLEAKRSAAVRHTPGGAA